MRFSCRELEVGNVFKTDSGKETFVLLLKNEQRGAGGYENGYILVKVIHAPLQEYRIGNIQILSIDTLVELLIIADPSLDGEAAFNESIKVDTAIRSQTHKPVWPTPVKPVEVRFPEPVARTYETSLEKLSREWDEGKAAWQARGGFSRTSSRHGPGKCLGGGRGLHSEADGCDSDECNYYPENSQSRPFPFPSSSRYNSAPLRREPRYGHHKDHGPGLCGGCDRGLESEAEGCHDYDENDQPVCTYRAHGTANDYLMEATMAIASARGERERGPKTYLGVGLDASAKQYQIEKLVELRQTPAPLPAEEDKWRQNWPFLAKVFSGGWRETMEFQLKNPEWCLTHWKLKEKCCEREDEDF